jgi:hypothetical protein
MRWPDQRRLVIFGSDYLCRHLSLSHSHLTHLPALTQVNSSDFPALIWLETVRSAYETISLGFKADNRLKTLVLHIEDNESGSWSETDAFISDAPMPNLQDVEIRFSGVYTDDDRWRAVPMGTKFDLESINLLFPRLHARGLLIVSDSRGS